MRNRHLLVIALVLIAASLIGMTVQASLGGGWSVHGPMTGPMMGWWSGGGPAPVAGANTLEVVATEFVFEPNQLEVGPGEAFNLTLKNEGTQLHDLTIPELGVQVVAGPGEVATVGVSATPNGRFQFLCTVPGHAQAGMVGMVVVSR